MQSATASRGRVGKLVAGADSVEIKATIARNADQARLEALRSRREETPRSASSTSSTRPGSTLFRGGIIARARRIVDKQHDSTIKIRPVRAEKVPAKWHKESEFKIEADASENGVVLSASLTKPVAKGDDQERRAGEGGD